MDEKMRKGQRKRPLEERRSGMTTVSELLARVTPDHGVDWAVVVGSTLGGLTVPLGVNDAGVLRVMAVNETVQRELQARTESLLAVWNLAAEQQETQRAQSLQCWVHAGLVTRGHAPRSRESTAVAKPTVSERYRTDADAMTGPVRDSSVRAALVEMRAKSLAARVRKEQGE
jgi:hypothetical protein